MRLIFSEASWSDYLYWQEADRAILERINALIKDMLRSPFVGIGKPEPLVGSLKGFWSRRITKEHRSIYRVSGAGDLQSLEIAACRYHYLR
jgi:toxin YoeB